MAAKKRPSSSKSTKSVKSTKNKPKKSFADILRQSTKRTKVFMAVFVLLFASVGYALLDRSSAATATLMVRSRDADSNQLAANGSKFELYVADGFGAVGGLPGYTYKLLGTYSTHAGVQVESGKTYLLRIVSAAPGYDFRRWDNNNAVGVFTVGYGNYNGQATVGFRGTDAAGQELTMQVAPSSSGTPETPKEPRFPDPKDDDDTTTTPDPGTPKEPKPGNPRTPKQPVQEPKKPKPIIELSPDRPVNPNPPEFTTNELVPDEPIIGVDEDGNPVVGDSTYVEKKENPGFFDKILNFFKGLFD